MPVLNWFVLTMSAIPAAQDTCQASGFTVEACLAGARRRLAPTQPSEDLS